MNITTPMVIKSRIPEYLAKREQWDRDHLREQCFDQSARTVAGGRADFDEKYQFTDQERA